MSSCSTLPSELHHLVPSGDGRQPAEPLEDGSYVVAGRRALIHLDQEGVIDSGLWHEVQFARWNADQKKLSIVWSQPDRAGISGVTVTEDAARLMEAITVRTERTILATRSFITSSGGRVSATVRRRPDGGLFSVLVADGDVTPADIEKGEELERTLRAELGMEDA